MFWCCYAEVEIFVKAILEMHAIKKENATVFPVEQVCCVGFEKNSGVGLFVSYSALNGRGQCFVAGNQSIETQVYWSSLQKGSVGIRLLIDI